VTASSAIGFLGDDFLGDDFLGDDFLGDDFLGDDFLGDDFLGDDFLGDDFLGDGFLGDDLLDSSFLGEDLPGENLLDGHFLGEDLLAHWHVGKERLAFGSCCIARLRGRLDLSRGRRGGRGFWEPDFLPAGQLVRHPHDVADIGRWLAFTLQCRKHSRQGVDCVVEKVQHRRRRLDRLVEHTIQHVLDLPRVLADRERANQPATPLERVEGAPYRLQLLEVAEIVLPERVLAIEVVELILHLFDEHLADLVINLVRRNRMEPDVGQLDPRRRRGHYRRWRRCDRYRRLRRARPDRCLRDEQLRSLDFGHRCSRRCLGRQVQPGEILHARGQRLGGQFPDHQRFESFAGGNLDGHRCDRFLDRRRDRLDRHFDGCSFVERREIKTQFRQRI
jgi:hypothetical protein